MGGESIQIERAMDILSIGYVHPAMLVLFSIWAVGRASGAIAGEIDRGTMELLLAQPMARYRVVLGHLAVDGITIPLLCLSMWAGTWAGCWFFTPIPVTEPEKPSPDPRYQKLLQKAQEVNPEASDAELLGQLMKLASELRKENAQEPFDKEELKKFVLQTIQQQLRETSAVDPAERDKLLEVHPAAFGPSLCNVAAMLFAISGYTMWLSAAGRYRWRV